MKLAMLSGVKNRNIQSEEARRLYKKAVQFWYSEWSAIMQAVDPAAGLDMNDFLSADYVIYLYEEVEGEIKSAGLHMYRHVDTSTPNSLLSELSHSKFTPEYFKKVQELGIQKTLTMEYFLVHKDYRARKSGLAPLILYIGAEVLKDLNLDAFITSARVSVGASKIACAIGFEVIEKIALHGEATDLLIGAVDKISYDQTLDKNELTKNEIRERAQELYSQRLNLLGGTYGSKKIAA